MDAATQTGTRRAGRARAPLAGLTAVGLALGALVGGAPGASAATAGLSLVATASPAEVSTPGQQLGYSVTVRNRGDQAVRDLLVSAPTGGVSAPVCSPVALGGTLGAGATTTCRATRTTDLESLGRATLTATLKATGSPVGGTTAVSAQATVSVPVTTSGPVATDDTAGAVDTGPSVLLAGASNDRPGQLGGPAIVPARTVLLAPAAELSYGGRRAGTEDGEWSTLPDGRIRFSPGYGRSGTVASIGYRVYDAAGRSAVGHLTVPVRRGPTGVAHDFTTPQDTAVTLDPLATDDPGQDADGSRSSFDPASLKVYVVGYPPPYPTTNGPDAKSVDLALAGRFVVTSGKVVLTPATGFVGAVSAYYEARTTSGATVAGTLDVRVTAVPGGPTLVRPALPVATDDHVVTTNQITTALPAQLDDIPGRYPFVNSKLTFPGDQLATLPTGSTIVYADGAVTLTLPGQGAYQTRFGTQQVLFIPKPGFVGDATPVQYRVTDTAGNTARATLSVTVLPGITERPDYVGTPQGQPVTVDVRANDDSGPSSRTWASHPVTEPRLTTHGNPGSVTSGTYQEELTVPGQGVYTVDPGSGTVTFAPEPGFVGTSTASVGILMQVDRPDVGSEQLGFETRLVVTVRPSTPVARADTASTPVGQPVSVPVLANDGAGSPAVPLQGTSVRLRTTSALPAGSVLYGDAKTLVVAGRGTFLVSGTGQVTFVPHGTTTGPVPSVGYQVADANGTTARSSLTVTTTAR